MPALNPDQWTTLPRIEEPNLDWIERPVIRVVTAPSLLEGAGFPVRRPWPSADLGFRQAGPFLLLDHLGAVEYAPGEAKGAPWHLHRGFETVTYIIDGAMAHHDSQGGGGLNELSRHLAYAEAGVSEIALESSWFFDRCVEPLGHIRLMLDLPRRNFGPFRP